MHFCPDEAMAIVAALPLIPWLLSRIVWWRARHKKFEPAPEGGGWSEDRVVEVRECRGCGTEIERKI